MTPTAVKPSSVEKTRQKMLDNCRKALLKKRKETIELKEKIDKSSKVILQSGEKINSESAKDSGDHVPALKCSEQLTGVLQAIDVALERIKKNDPKFGVCEECEESIPVARLTAIPWAKLCTSCKEREENGKYPMVVDGGQKRVIKNLPTHFY